MPMRSRVGAGPAPAAAARPPGAAVRAIATIASRSTPAQTASRIAAMRACASSTSLAGHEAEVALDDAEARILADRAEHRDAREALDGGAQLPLVARARPPG